MEPHHIFGGFLIVQDLGALHSIRLGRRLPRRRDLRRVECLGLKAPVLEVSTGVEVDRVRQPRRRHLLRCADNEVLTSATGRMITRWHDPGSMGVHGSACGVVEKDTAGDRCGLRPASGVTRRGEQQDKQPTPCHRRNARPPKPVVAMPPSATIAAALFLPAYLCKCQARKSRAQCCARELVVKFF